MPAATGSVPSFDPRYLDFLIQSWQTVGLESIERQRLVVATQTLASARLDELASMGMRYEEVSDKRINEAITLLKKLGLLKQSTSRGRKNSQPRQSSTPTTSPMTYLSPTSDGRMVLHESPATGGIRVGLVQRLLTTYPALRDGLRTLQEEGPLVKPVRQLAFGAPSRGKAYTEALVQGLQQFWALPALVGRRFPAPVTRGQSTRSPTPAQLLSSAQAQARSFPTPGSKWLEKDVMLSELGLLWIGIEQVNDVIAAHYTGAAVVTVNDTMSPHTPNWEDIRAPFVAELLRAYQAHADGTGAASIADLRGALGQSLRLGPTVVDDLLCHAREAGDRHEESIRIHFEPDDDRIYAADRSPLIWRGAAYDFVEVKRVDSAAYAMRSGVEY